MKEQQAPQPLSQRVANLEAQIEQHVAALNSLEDTLKNTIGTLHQLILRVSDLSQRHLENGKEIEQVENRMLAVIRVLEADKEGTLKRINQEKTDIEIEILKQKIQFNVDSGALEATNLVNEDCLVVWKEELDNGTVSVPRVQYTYAMLQRNLGEDIAKLFLSKTVGESFKLVEDGDRKITILEIYKELTK